MSKIMKEILLKFSDQVLSKRQLKTITGGYGGCGESENSYNCSILLNGTNTPVTGTGCGTTVQDAEARCRQQQINAGFQQNEFICSCN
jgi:natural product precursor